MPTRCITAAAAALAVTAGTSLAAEVFSVQLEVSASSFAEITYGIDIFQPDPVFAAQLNSGVTGFVDVTVEIDAGRVTSFTLDGFTLVADEMLVANITDGQTTATATLEGLSVTMLDSGGQQFFTASAEPGAPAQWGYAPSVGFTGMLSASYEGQALGEFDLSEQTADFPFLNGQVRVEGDRLILDSTAFIMGGDFGDPIDPTVGNFAYFGSATINAEGVVPSPGSAVLFGLAGLLVGTSRRRG